MYLNPRHSGHHAMSFSHTWNLVKQFAAYPCAEPNPIIWYVTFAPAVAPALMEWFTFGCRDIMKFRIGRSAPCGRALKGQVGKMIPPAWQSVAGNLLKFEARFSYAGQLFFLADLTSDTLARWTTLAYQLNKCPQALDGAAWQIEQGGPMLLLPDTPTIIGGTVINAKGQPGIAWGTGAVVPPGWYCQLSFECRATAFRAGGAVGLKTWVHTQTFAGFDYPAVVYPKGYPGKPVKGGYHTQVQNTHSSLSMVLTMFAEVTEAAWITNLTAAGSASPFPVSDWTLSPMGCLRDLTTSIQQNPRGGNPKSRNPGLIPKWLLPTPPAPPRGPPGGRPRRAK